MGASVTLFECFRAAGVCGLAVMLLGVVLLGTGILLLALARSAEPFWYLLFLALGPVLLGGLGTFLGCRDIEAVLNTPGVQAKQAEIDEAYAQARVTTYMGMGAAAPLLVVGIIGLVVKGKKPAPER